MWLKVDDKLASDPAWMAIEPAAAGEKDKQGSRRSVAAKAKLVHLVASVWGADCNCDGKVPPGAIPTIAAWASLSTKEVDDAIDVLVKARMWKVAKSGWVMQVTWRPGDQPTEQEIKERRRKDRRRTELHRKKDYLKDEAKERAEGQCEYCGVTLPPGDGEFDHVDDKGDNDIENLAWVCIHCNRRKSDRSLAEARMSFTPEAIERRSKWREKKADPGPGKGDRES